jgi:hypothetical protein
MFSSDNNEQQKAIFSGPRDLHMPGYESLINDSLQLLSERVPLDSITTASWPYFLVFLLFFSDSVNSSIRLSALL